MLKPAEIALLAWSQMDGIGPRTIYRVLAADEWMDEADPQPLLQKFAAGRPETERNDALEAAKRICEQSNREGINILTMRDLRYPQPLRNIVDPPPFLYFRGTLPDDWANAVAVVGTREPDDKTTRATMKVVDSLTRRRSTIIVSGLALGTDTIAHAVSLECGLRTVAVLGNGLDTVYPKANAELAQRIVDAGGCLLSESPIGCEVSKFSLVARDRLQSGLSTATFLMQSSLDGGSMHTALSTLTQKRTLIALKPPDPKNPKWRGNAFLLGKLIAPPATGCIAQFRCFSRPFAQAMSADLIEPFVERGLERGFVPREEEKLTFRFGL
ncbi:MAG TPA: DNA-processing protein DprA [Candidatus Baltobacteraceae bacterium]|jgi:DNA processing protein|nr:DNA-processing protein DprA [Candidatus Baltobacteraceae bacterium]